MNRFIAIQHNIKFRNQGLFLLNRHFHIIYLLAEKDYLKNVFKNILLPMQCYT